MDSSELDVLDRRVAELLGWKHTVGVFVSSWKEAELFQIEAIEADGIVSGGECFFLTENFSPTRDARQAGVLLGELNNKYVSLYTENSKWFCYAATGTTTNTGVFLIEDYIAGEGDDWKHAVVIAWIAWKEQSQ